MEFWVHTALQVHLVRCQGLDVISTTSDVTMAGFVLSNNWSRHCCLVFQTIWLTASGQCSYQFIQAATRLALLCTMYRRCQTCRDLKIHITVLPKVSPSKEKVLPLLIMHDDWKWWLSLFPNELAVKHIVARLNCFQICFSSTVVIRCMC